MLNPEHFIVSFARAVELIRTMPDAVPEQKSALRALVALCKLGSVQFRVDGSDIKVADDPVPNSLPNIPALLVQLRDHSVSTIEIDQDAAPADLLTLLRYLAAPSGDRGLVLSGETVRVASETVPGEPDDASEVSPPAADNPAAEAEREQPIAEPEQINYFEGLQGTGTKIESLEEALSAIHAAPYEGDILGKLTAFAEAIRDQMRLDKVELVLPALASLIDLELNAPDEPSRRAYGITLIRLLEGNILSATVDMLLDHRFHEGARRLLQRAGHPAFEILTTRLDDAGSVDEARIYAKVLKPLVEDARPLIPLLQHARWPIAESVANLLGELAVSDAVPALGDAVQHDDARVKRAAVVALCRIGDRAAVEHMLKAVASNDDVLRSAVISGVEGQKSGALAMPILMIAEQESTRPEVRRDCYLALGRIGTPEALRSLVTAAEPGGRVVGRKSTERRVAAIDGLRHADDRRILVKLKQLTADREKGVRAAAELALAEVTERLGVSTEG